MDKTKIQEMAYSRIEIIHRCKKYGKPFVEHFDKVMKAGGIKDPDFIHHTDVEMQNWFNQVATAIVSYNKKVPDDGMLTDYFFRLGKQPLDSIIEKPYIGVYEKFVFNILSDRKGKMSIALGRAIVSDRLYK